MSRSTDYLYAPLQSSPRALGIFVLVLGVFGGLALLTGGTLWPIFPIQSRWHLLFWLIAACTPVICLQLGWTYELTDREFVVRRFGTERHRVALAEYVDRTMTLGYQRLHFQTRSFWLASAADQERAAFLDELDRRLFETGAIGTEALIPTESGKDLTIRIGRLRFPNECVRCGTHTTSRVEIEGRRGYDFVVAASYRAVPIPVPVCDHHARAHSKALRAVPIGLFVAATLLVGVVGMLVGPSRTLGTSWVLGLVVGVIAVRIGQALRVRRFIDAYVLGVSAVSVDGDLEKVTLRIADDGLRARIVRQATNEVRANVFG